MNLAIDVGNTLVKLAVFNNGKLQQKKTCIKKDFLTTLSTLSETFKNIDSAIVSTVSNFTDHQFLKLQQRFQVHTLDYQTKIPFTNKYTTPKTLGVDRIALISAAAIQFPKKNVLVIDVGTCITYDYLTHDNEYLGGAISPGIGLRYKALNNYTEKLPLLDPNTPTNMVGNSTASSIHSGVIFGIVNEIDGFIDAYKTICSNLTVILTGGDAHFLRENLKNNIFANSNFLLEGLNHILEYNKR